MSKSIALTPPMGWNSWDCYGASVRENEVRGNADYMEKHLKKYGWEYVVVDIQWYEPTADSTEYHPYAPLDMDQYGRLIPSVNRFPSAKDGNGFKALGEYIHSKGLKFGIHILRGIPKQAVKANTPILGTDKFAKDIADTNSICPWNTDMYGIDATKEGAQEYYNSIINMYAEWGFDFIKVDDLSFPYAKGEIELIKNALDNCGRDVVFSLSPGSAPLEEAEHLKVHANMWRISGDFWDNWEQLYKQFELLGNWNEHMGASHWPDADMLPFGHICLREHQFEGKGKWTNFTRREQRTLMTLWCIARSPLMFGGVMTDNDQWTLELITNEEVLNVLKYSNSNKQFYKDEDKAIWTAKGKDGENYVALFNISDIDSQVELDLREVGIEKVDTIRDLWQHEDFKVSSGILSNKIKAHEAKFYKIK
ncbi:glycoside hydrolase family 27 protein [Clostridium folliculivorans]|uniref:Alpha-galactosidase n=1 Tax=Clostridium folliculivorans TaxID=2886038 RepID=A0A9W5Y569_9CLOT|nr:glycoside hydrolase family 27 protein [Clostridium folliculivorans]GKU26652.1 alpha-galactosidase [Clostridium folliculivorans]GKU28916.1 alpha-galactosidase [Clostridium folliculivorans]